jgi:hypothetical protein
MMFHPIYEVEPKFMVSVSDGTSLLELNHCRYAYNIGPTT